MLIFVFKRGVVDGAATVCDATSIYMASTIATGCADILHFKYTYLLFEKQCNMSVVCWPR